MDFAAMRFDGSLTEPETAKELSIRWFLMSSSSRLFRRGWLSGLPPHSPTRLKLWNSSKRALTAGLLKIKNLQIIWDIFMHFPPMSKHSSLVDAHLVNPGSSKHWQDQVIVLYRWFVTGWNAATSLEDCVEVRQKIKDKCTVCKFTCDVGSHHMLEPMVSTWSKLRFMKTYLHKADLNRRVRFESTQMYHNVSRNSDVA